MEENKLTVELMEIYKNNGVVSGEGTELKNLLLHEKCGDKNTCWKGCDINRASEWNSIQLPYIGESYAGHLAVLGINLNLSSGTSPKSLTPGVNLRNDDIKKLVDEVKKGLSSGQKKIRFAEAPNYRGSLFWHRMALYSFMLLQDDWELDKERKDIIYKSKSLLDSFQELTGIFRGIAFLETIKCSPGWEKSTPTVEMWSKCPERFLKPELEILAPDNILVLGRSVISALCLDPNKPDKTSKMGGIKVFHKSLRDKKITVYSVIHPTAFGGSSKSVILEFGEFLKQT